MSWAKSDGAKIKITFDRPIVSGQTGQQSFFTVTVPEYTFVPGGTLQNVTKTVKSTYALAGVQQTLDLSTGTLTDTTVTDGVLSLGVT
jgi:methenyltetrahydromethanopterin cyclohydrolase